MHPYFFKKNTYHERRARDLKRGDSTPVGVVDRVERLNGKNGEKAVYVGSGREKTAIGLRIHFQDRPEPLVVHPNAKLT